MKKIVYILKSFAVKAGTERVVSDKMNWLSAHGYEVTLVTYEQGKHPQAFQLHPGIRHIDLDVRFFEIAKYGKLKHLWHLKRMRSLFRSRLQSLIDEIQPDIIVSTTYSIKMMDIILSVKTSARRIVESHVACFSVKKSYDYRNKPLLRNIASMYDQWMLNKLNKAELLIVLTEGDAIEWRRYVSNVMVIPNPVTLYPDTVLPHDGSGHRIISVGRLHEQKGFDMLIDAFALIADKCPDWKIDIFGDGQDKPILTEKIREHGLSERIIINPPTSEIYSEYQSSEFLVLSSRYEGFALVLLEAMSCGIPCVSFKCKFGPEEIIDDGVNGLLVENGNVRELSEKMLWMITHQDDRLRMGRDARDRIIGYKIELIMQRWESLFQK